MSLKKAKILQHSKNYWPISIHNWVYIFHRVLSDPYSDVLCLKECQPTKLSVCCQIFASFKAIFKFCTAKNCKNNTIFLSFIAGQFMNFMVGPTLTKNIWVKDVITLLSQGLKMAYQFNT